MTDRGELVEQSRTRSLPGWLAPAGLGLGGGIAAGAACLLLLGFAPLVAVGVGIVVGGGAALLTAPLAPAKLDLGAPAPTTVSGMLEASLASAGRMEQAMRRLTSRALWAGSPLDERIAGLIGGIRSLASTPALKARSATDGDVSMVYVLATDYLPTIVNLAIENDRMHSSFSGRSSRAQVEANVARLEQQAAILADVLDRVETDVAKGTSRDIEEHAAFLRARFERFGDDSPLDLSVPLRSTPAERGAEHPTPGAIDVPGTTLSDPTRK